MPGDIMENIQLLGPAFALIWLAVIACTVLRPQRFFNSLLLLAAILVSMVFVSGFLGEAAGEFLLACFLLVALALFLVPAALIANGVQMIRRESVSASHLLSLGLGVFVGIGEIASVVYVLGLSEAVRFGAADMWILFVACTVFYFSFLVLSFVVYSLFIQIMPHRMRFQYIVVHGCSLAGGERVGKLLASRVDKAIDIYRRCPVKPVIIPSGGQGRDEKRSEAAAMAEYLLERGVPGERILLEDRSATTRENLLFSKEIINARPGAKRTALVSSSYHVYRCLRLAREVGLPCTGIGAHVAPYYWPSALIREFIAVFTSRPFLIWSLAGYALFVGPVLYALLRALH